MKTVLVVGAGKFGSLIAKRMTELGSEVMVVDKDENNIDALLPYVNNATIGDCANKEFIDSLGVGNYDVCFVSIGNDFETSLVVSAMLKDAGAKHVISRASSDIQTALLLRIGCDEVIYPEKMMAERIATRYASDKILDYIQLDNSKYSIYELKVPREWKGMTLKQLDIRNRHGVNIVALKKENEVVSPNGDTVIDEGDVAFVIGETKSLQKLFKFDK